MKQFFPNKTTEYTNPEWIMLVDDKSRRTFSPTRIISTLAVCAFIIVGIIFYSVSANNAQDATSSPEGMITESSAALLEPIRNAIDSGDYALAQSLLDQQRAESADDPILLGDLNALAQEITDLAVDAAEQASNELDAAALNIISDPAQLFQLATDAFAKEQWAIAIDRFEQLRELNENYQREATEEELVTAYLSAAANAVTNDPRNRSNLELALRYYQNVLLINSEEATAQIEREFLSAYLIGERALETESYREAVNTLLPIYRERPEFLSGWSAQQLYNAYIALGDSAMRRGDRNTATNYFNLANELNVTDKSDGERRLQSIALLPTLTPSPDRATATPTVTPTSNIAFVPATGGQVVADATSEPQLTPTPVLNPPACPDPRSVITAPLEGQVVSSYVQIQGTAQHDEFVYYKLEFAPRTSAEFAFLESHEETIIGGYLGTLDSSTVPNGDYTIRLIVVDDSGNYPPPCEVHITVEN